MICRARNPERGAITVVVATGSLVLALLGVAAADLGTMVIARVRAQTAADAAALAAASALAPILAGGDTPQARAERAATANGAHLTRCHCTSGAVEAIVDVEIIVSATIVRAWDGVAVRASARAVLDRDVYSYRG